MTHAQVCLQKEQESREGRDPHKEQDIWGTQNPTNDNREVFVKEV